MFPFMAAALVVALSFATPAAPAAAPAPDSAIASVELSPRMASAVAERTAPVIEWTITVDTIGYQDALDACLWTRMDFDGVVPIVGAHNFCGGDIVLDMKVGEIVHLSGADVDGTYVVTGDRQVFPGDDAIEATAGLDSPVLLQTCYWDVDQGMRLVVLSPVG